jgi:hypothetical protein
MGLIPMKLRHFEVLCIRDDFKKVRKKTLLCIVTWILSVKTKNCKKLNKKKAENVRFMRQRRDLWENGMIHCLTIRSAIARPELS